MVTIRNNNWSINCRLSVGPPTSPVNIAVMLSISFYKNPVSCNFSLSIEKRRTTKLEKKLQFVKDNQEVFMRLKEAYINMKYNEAAGRKMIEIREKGVQTWEGTICSSCMESEELRRQIDIMMQKYSELFVVSPCVKFF